MVDKKREKYRRDVNRYVDDIKKGKIKSIASPVISKQQEEKIRKDNELKNKENYKNIKNMFRADNWINAITGMGGTQDKSYYTYFSGYNYLTDQMLGEMWIGEGLGHKIVSARADDMTREWINIENDEENILCNKLEKLKAEKEFNLAVKWKRLFGGAIIAIGINDGRDISEPVNPNAIKSIDWIKTYPRTNVHLTDYNFDNDPNSPGFGEVEWFTVSPNFGTVFNIHRDRCLVFKGIEVPDNVQTGNFWYWGMSCLQPIWNELTDVGAGRRNVAKLLYEFIIGKYKLQGLAELLAEGNEELLRNRMNAIDLSKSMIQSVLIDSEEDYTRDNISVAGLPELLDRFMMFIAGVSDYPVTRLFGRSPAGQNATGKNDIVNYYDIVRSSQKNVLKNPLQDLINLINVSKEIGNKKVENPNVLFNSLFQQSDKEIIEVKKMRAEIDNIYYQMGVLSDEEIRVSRFENGYSLETGLLDIEFEEPEENEEE
jgi:phage-related protein (TIGR01555 family)